MVDDSPDFSLLVRLILKKLGHEVHIADTGTSGVQECKRLSPDLVFLDMTLPDMNGGEVAKNIVQECQPNPIIVGLTGHNPEDIAEDIQGSGMKFCVQKPMGFNELAEVLEHAIEDASPCCGQKVN